MSEPKPWSSASSDVDPVLRALLIYARDQQPSPEQLAALVSGAGRRRRAWPRPVLARISGIAIGLALAGAGFAAGSLRQRADSTAPVAQPSARPSAAAPPVSPAVSTARPSAAVPPGAPEPHRSPSPSSRSATESVAQDSEQDARLLHAAQRAMVADPARALTLTRDHELHFPLSALSEERRALRIEALTRLERRAEAERELRTFEQAFPRSIYRRRLRALLPP
jgi:hypothetical protein